MSYGYDAIGQLTSATGLAGLAYVSATTYNARGQVTQLVNDSGANGVTRKYTYEANSMRLSVLQAGNNATLYDNRQKLTYTYDRVPPGRGNIKTLLDTVNSSQKQCFGYDGLHRLTTAYTTSSANACTSYSATGSGLYNHTYTYDAIGNITSNAGNAYTYGDAAHKHAVTAAFGNSYAYDANGNQTSRTIAGVVYTLTYDYENRLTAVSGGSISASFVYDADGNRVKGTVNGITTVYVAGVYEYQNGATTLYYEGSAMRRTGYASDNGVFYNLQDQLKSTSSVLNQNGTLNGAPNYFFPYGGKRSASFSPLTTKRFTGQYHEAGLPGGEGLSYYNARWYDAQLGRFASADTIVPGPSNPQALNRYSYVQNNPTGRIDPTGHYDVVPGDAPYSYNSGSNGGLAVKTQPKVSRNFLPSSWYKAVAPTVFTGLPFDVPTGQNVFWMNHFGATDFAKANAARAYSHTSGLHGGVDFMVPSGTSIYSRTTGIVVGFNTHDADPNVVVKVSTQAMGDLYVVYGHVTANPNLQNGSTVTPDTPIGTIWSNPDGDHIHLTIYQDRDGVRTTYNPLYFFGPTTFDYDSHIRVQPNAGGLAVDQHMWKFNYSTNSFWNGDDVGAVDTSENRIQPPR